MRDVFPTFFAPATITLNLIIVFTPSFFDYNLIIVNIKIKVLIFNHKILLLILIVCFFNF